MIEIKNVTFNYSGLDQAGLSDFNLSVTDGECILLCGASGCGKTTVTRLRGCRKFSTRSIGQHDRRIFQFRCSYSVPASF